MHLSALFIKILTEVVPVLFGAVLQKAATSCLFRIVGELRIRRLFHKTWKELGSKEAAAMITAACALLRSRFSNAADSISQIAKQTNRYVNYGNLVTTGRLLQHDGEEYRTEFTPPAGYSTCDARVDVHNGSITGGSTFNGSVRWNKEDRVGVYAVVPKNRRLVSGRALTWSSGSCPKANCSDTAACRMAQYLSNALGRIATRRPSSGYRLAERPRRPNELSPAPSSSNIGDFGLALLGGVVLVAAEHRAERVMSFSK